jgi:hypothetical protein
MQKESGKLSIPIFQGVLVSLATFTFTTNFKRTSPFAHLLPPWSRILTHPFDTLFQVFWVFKMHSDHVSLQTAERRKQNIDDVEKRREYRRAHGLEEDEKSSSSGSTGEQGVEREGEQAYTDWEGKKRRVKKWLGIW